MTRHRRTYRPRPPEERPINRITFRSLHPDLNSPNCPFKKNGGDLEVDKEKFDGLWADFAQFLEYMQKEDSGEVPKKLLI